MMRPLVMAILGVFPTIAIAQPLQGPYVSGDVGVNFAGSLQSSHETTEVYTDAGPLGIIALGWGFGNGLRTEVEGSYRSNSITGISTRRIDGLLEPLANVSGGATTYALMANIAYDIPIHPFGLPIQPYVGAGVGYGWLDFSNIHGNGLGRFSLPDNNTFTGPDIVTFGSAGAFAYQATVGASLPLPICRGLEMTFEYKLFGLARSDIPVNRVTTSGDLVNGVLPSNSTRNGFEVLDNDVLIGVRYAFGAP